MLEAMARIAPSHPNEAMARIAPRSPMVPVVNNNNFHSTQAPRQVLWTRFEISLEGPKIEKGIGLCCSRKLEASNQHHAPPNPKVSR
jgi:hypothetical protein